MVIMDQNAKFHVPQTARGEAVIQTRDIVGVVYLDMRGRSVIKVPIMCKRTATT